MEFEFLQAKWLRLWFFWIVAVVLGSSRIGDALLEFLGSKIFFGYAGYYSPLFLLSFALFFLVNGGIAGLAQWLVLRLHIAISGWLWIFTTILESIISLYLLDVDIAGSYVAFVFYSGMIGVLIGSLQWLMLRRRMNRAGWWILILAAGHMISAVIFLVTRSELQMYNTNLVSTAVYGALTGAGLIALLVQSSKGKKSASFLGSNSQRQ